MLEFLFVSLLQAVAGAPAHPAPLPPSTQEQTASGPADAAPSTDAPSEQLGGAQQQQQPAAQPQTRRERRCVEVEVSGRRLPRRECRMVEVPVEPDQPAAQ